MAIVQPVSLVITTALFFSTVFSIDCQVGEFESASVCVQCSPGYYNNATAQTSCNNECPSGTWSGEGASACTECTKGTTQFDLSTANTEANSKCDSGCDVGYAFETSECTLCPAGFYSRNVTVASSTSGGCMACATGYTTSGFTAASGCTVCSAGFGNANCAQCPTGWTSANLNDPSTDGCILCDDATACNNQGTCLSSGKCECEPEYHGRYCSEVYNDCDLNICGVNGDCNEGTRTETGVKAYTCTCDDGYTSDESFEDGPICSEDLPCDTVDCYNPDGVCKNYRGADGTSKAIAKCGFYDETLDEFKCDSGYEPAA